MHLIVQTYSLIELQQLRSELETRGIGVHVSDEFTYAIPGMPGAEQPRGLWVSLEEDITPARRVVADLVGEDRLAPDDSVSSPTDRDQPGREQAPETRSRPAWLWPVVFAVGAAVWALNADT